MKPKLYQTGQVSVILELKYKTLYNYLRDFGKFFSETARQKSKGKRWTEDDLQTLQAIRHLHNERKGAEQITKLLADGWRPPVRLMYNAEDINRLLETSWQALAAANELLTESKKHLDRIDSQIYAAEKSMRHFYDHQKEHDSIQHELKRIRFFLRPPRSESKRNDFYYEWDRYRKELAMQYLAEEEQKKQKADSGKNRG